MSCPYLEHAAEYYRMGYNVMPILNKQPLLKGWQHWSQERITPELFKEHQAWIAECRFPAGLGIVAGKFGGIAIDIDVNDDTLLDLCRNHSSYERINNKGAIYLFKYDSLCILQRSKESPIELLTNKSYFVVPPTPNKLGANSYWKGDDPRNVSPDELPFAHLPALYTALEKICVAKGLRRRELVSAGGQPMSGYGRNNTLTAYAYALACAGHSEEEGAQLLKDHACADWFTDPNETHKETPKKMFARAIAAADKKGERFVTMKLDLPFLTEEGKKEEEKKAEYVRPPLPKSGKILDLINAIQCKNDGDIPALALGGAIAICATLASNRVRCGEIWPNIFVLNIAATGVGKAAAYNIAARLLGDSNLIGHSGYRSATAITDGVYAQRERLDVLDEVSAMFRMMREGSVFQMEMVDVLCGLWSAGPSRFYLTHSMRQVQDKKQKTFWNPCINILASTTEAGLIDASNKMMIDKGLFPRFIIFTQPRLGWVGRRDDVDLGPLLEWVRSLPRIKTNEPTNGIDLNNSDYQRLPTDVPFAGEFALDFQRKCFEEEDPSPFAVRRFEQVTRLALIQAFANDDKVITLDSFKWAESVFEWTLQENARVREEMAAEGFYGRMGSSFTSFVLKARRRGVTKSELARKFQGMPPKTRNDVLTTLVDAGIIVAVQEKTGAPHATFRYFDSKYAKSLGI